MERNCLYCEIPIDKKKHGLVKFCSTQCRNKYYYQNKQVREIHDSEKNSYNNNQFIQNTSNEKQGNNLSGYPSQKQVIPENNNEWRGNISDSSRGVLANDVIRFMEENFKTKAELVASELKLENALKPLTFLSQYLVDHFQSQHLMKAQNLLEKRQFLHRMIQRFLFPLWS